MSLFHTESLDFVVVARMGSSRFPGKSLHPFCGTQLVPFIFSRILHHYPSANIILATTTDPIDDPLEDICRLRDIQCFRGSTDDVLGRVYEASKLVNNDYFVELLGDNPFFSISELNRTLELFHSTQPDYASCATREYTFLESRAFYPIGIRSQVMTKDFIADCHLNSALPLHREHLTHFINQRHSNYNIELLAPNPETEQILFNSRSDLTFSVNLRENIRFLESLASQLPQVPALELDYNSLMTVLSTPFEDIVFMGNNPFAKLT